MSRFPRTCRVVGGVTLALLISTGGVAGVADAATKAVKAPTKLASAKSAVPTTFPKVKVIDLATAKTVDLASFNVTNKPQLVWFWAPT